MTLSTLKDYVTFFKKPAYLYKNGYTNKWQYFIPRIDYDEIIIDNEFNQDTPTVLIKNQKIICSIKQLMGKDFLTGDANIFVVPIQYEHRPLLDVFTKNNTDDELIAE